VNVKGFRAPAVPLIIHDPFFSVWSHATNLTDDSTRHWTGVRQYIFGVVVFDKCIYEFMGKVGATDDRYFTGYEKLQQTSCEIRPMTTIYQFGHEKFTMELSFMSPLLLNDLDVLSRPVSYIQYKIQPKDDLRHDIHLQFGFSGEFCVNENMQKVRIDATPQSVYFTSGTDNMLKRSGDDHNIEWGSFHIASKGYTIGAMSLRSYQQKLSLEYASKLYPNNIMQSQGPNRERKGAESYSKWDEVSVYPEYPTIVIKKEFVTNGEEIGDWFALAYDDEKSLQYFGENIDAYWKKDGITFGEMLGMALEEYSEICEKVVAFEDELLEKANVISPKYADIISLAYRQAIAGHKLTYHDGEIQFVSKENYSNGCAATVDITYPSMPLFLMYQPELVEGMLNPIFKLIEKGLWRFEFAPHDAGTYPLVNGQVYGFGEKYQKLHAGSDEHRQMPVEECGNMILCVAATCFAKKDMAYFVKHRALLTQWADYLVGVGYDPQNQLCTDDFSGHLAHNCNLSAKAICALGAFAKCLRKIGEDSQADEYESKAREFERYWEEEAYSETHYRLTFDQPDSWSLKYNMVWDKLFGLNLFSQKVYDTELAWYKTKMNAYGIPLDNRGDCTKTDWQMWSTRLFDDKEYTDMIVDKMWAFLSETPNRTPFSDLIFTSKPYERAFRARTVQGGLFINLLEF